MSWELHVLGANSAVPTVDRYPSGQVLNMGSHSIMIDCGEGSQIRMLEYGIRMSRISTILISHMHGDHIFGLPGLLTSYNLYRRKTPLRIIGPEGIDSFVNFMIGITQHEFNYPVEIVEVKADKPFIVLDDPNYRIKAFPLVHRLPTYGYKIEEKITRTYLSKEKVKEMELTDSQVKTILGGDSITIGTRNYDLSDFQRHPSPLSYAYVSDTAYFKECATYIGPVRLLYHEATFLDADKKLARERYHATAREAAKTAVNAPADHLVLGHYSSRYKDIEEFRKEAESVFGNVSLALSGRKFRIPQE